MKSNRYFLMAMLLAAVIAPSLAQAGTPYGDRIARRKSERYPWHGHYYHVAWGQPVALVAPPVADLQTHWSWGVAQTSVTPLWHRYRKNYPGPYGGGNGFRATPLWPSRTDQFGVYYVRGPW